MKKAFFSMFILGFVALFSANASAQATNPHKVIKNHINKVVENVHEATEPDTKREILDSSLSDMITAINRVEGMHSLTDNDRDNLAVLKNDLKSKKDELNGVNGYTKVPEGQLNEFANYVQQDFEQADTVVTLSLTAALLIALILLIL